MERDGQPSAAEGAQSRDRRRDLARVVGVVVVPERPSPSPAQGQATVGERKAPERRRRRPDRYPDRIRRRDRGEGVCQVVKSRNGEREFPCRVSPKNESCRNAARRLADLSCKEISARFGNGKGQRPARPGKTRKARRHDPRLRPRKILPRRPRKGGKIGEIVDVVEFQIEEQRVRRGKRQKRVGILARLDEEQIPRTDPETRAVPERPARDRRRGKPRVREDPVEHRGHGGLPVAARDGHADRAVPHQIRKEIGSRDQGDAARARTFKRRMVGRDRSRVDHGGDPGGKIRPLGIDLDARFGKNVRDLSLPILPRDRKAPQGGDLRKRRHPDAPDPDKPEERPGKEQTRRPLPAAQRILRQTDHPPTGYAEKTGFAIQPIDIYFTNFSHFLDIFAYY